MADVGTCYRLEATRGKESTLNRTASRMLPDRRRVPAEIGPSIRGCQD